MSPTPFLRADRLSVSRGRRLIVRELSVECGPGEVAWLVGENGSGKSSLLRVLAGLDRPRSGSVRRVGAERPGRTASSYYDPGMKLPPGVSAARWDRLVEALAPETADDPGRALRPPFVKRAILVRKISTGEERRLILAAVLRAAGDFVFLDEPYEHLSEEGRASLTGAIADLREGRVVVVATNRRIPEPLARGPVVRLGDSLPGGP